MGTTTSTTDVEPLPASFESRPWRQDRIEAQIEARLARLEELHEAAERGELEEGAAAERMRALNDEIDTLRLQVVQPHPGFPTGRRRPTLHGRRYTSVGAAIVDGLRLQAAFDGTSGGTASPSFFDPALRGTPTRRLFLRDLIPTERVSGDRVDYVRQTVGTNNAAAVAAGALKPTSIYSVERVSTPVAVIAHVSEAIDRSLLVDFPALQGFLDDVLVTGVLLAEEAQILNGSGVAPNLTGILNTAGIQTQAKGTDPTFDTIFRAMTKLRLQNFEPDSIVLHPNDWQEIRLTRTADGIYIQGSPVEAGAERLYDKPVIVSPVIAEGTGLVGAFAAGATVYDREQARVTFTETGLGDAAGQELYTRNQVRFRAESRLGLAVPFPAAFCSVTGI